MRILMRNELDTESPINLRRLTPVMKVYAGIVSKWHDTEYYKSKLNKQLEATYAARVEKDERLKEALLVLIYKELDNNETLSKRGEECQEVILCVKSNFIYSLERVLSHKDFLPYEVEKIEEDMDIRAAFPEMPIMIRVRKRMLQGVIV